MTVANIYRNHIHIPPLLKNTHRGPEEETLMQWTEQYHTILSALANVK